MGSNFGDLVAGDFNSDGRTDLAVAYFGSGTVTVLLGDGDGTFQPQAAYPMGGEPFALVAGDFNGDGRTDLAVTFTNFDSGTVSIFLSAGDGTFRPQAAYPVGTEPFGLVAGDFNGDGRADLAVANGYDLTLPIASVRLGNTVSVLLGAGDGTFQPQVAWIPSADR